MTVLVVITPVRDEAAHLPAVAAAMVAQHRRPDRWLIVDDGSSDETPRIAEGLAAEHGWIEALAAPQAIEADDRLAAAAEAGAFHWAFARLAEDAWDFVAKLDGDIVLRADHYDRLLAEMAADERLGIAGCYLEDEIGGRRVPHRMPPYHVNGALKLYRRACWQEIGGMPQRLGWDTLDETKARMLGWRTRSFADLRALHLRPSGSAGGQLRGRARHGTCAWIAGYPPELVALRALRLALARPYLLSGLAFAGGYLRAALVRRGRPDDPGLLRFSRREQRARLRTALRQRGPLRARS